MMNLGPDFEPSATLDVEQLEMGSQWILSMLNRAVAGTVEALEKWELSAGGHSGYISCVLDFSLLR